jgi:Arc/MetJ-type ribon-helix-helix transcriptional regulator
MGEVFCIMRKKLRFWNIQVPPKLDDEVEKEVATDGYVSKSDLVRDAVREKLARMGVTLEKEKT